uniref:Coiled-coil domain-containing protein 22 n=1 Tax=Mastacembelus armatus TaxID=205130 RepID=A0A7N9ATI2_9TELE
MEEVDKILIHALKQVGTEVSEEVDSVKQFSSELIVEAVVRCIRVIDPGLGGALPISLPPGMSARFRVGMSLAQACQDLGYKGEIGYQTFLYSNEPEIRSLLMFLVEKLPRESAEASDQPTGKSVVLQRAIAAAIRAQLAVPWLPANCRLPLHEETQVNTLKMHLSVRKRLFFKHGCTWDVGMVGVKGKPGEYRSRKLTRLRKRIEEQLRSAALPHPESSFGGPRSTSDLGELLQTFRGSAPPEQILSKGTHFTHTQKFTFTPVRTPPAKRKLRHQEELASLQQQFQQLCSDVDQLTADMKHMSVTNTQVLDELKQRVLGNSEKEERKQVKNKTIDLLPDADNNLLKLQALVEASANRVVNLASQWEKHRAPLIDEHRRLKEICSNQDLESSRKLSEIKSLHEKIRVSTEEAKKKEEMYKQLVTELENLSQDVSRSAYTQRILEIVSNIKKQKEEITKILSDTKELQKEINNLTGKLDRTFAVTDELIFKDAKKDESVRKSYKYLAALHENCNQLIQTIEDTGTILREIRDLEEQIETENGNKTVANLERILDDYKAIRQENSALAAKVREG